jgi:hypothetical protein
MALVYEGKTVKPWLIELARVRLAEMEKKGHFTQGEMRFYLMDRYQTLLSFFIGVVSGRLLPIGLMFVFIAI